MRPAAALVVALLAAAPLAGCVQPGPAAAEASGSVTLAEVVRGAFPSATDKRGSGGVTVVVHNVTVSFVRNEDDGDWHLNTTDGSWAPFVMEIIPRDQGAVAKPPLHAKLQITGVPFCDREHQTTDWHGRTCWELHPVLAWQVEPRSR